MDVERGEKVHASENRGVFSVLWKVLSVLALVAVLCAAVAYTVNAAGAYRSSSTSEDVFGGIDSEDEDNFKYDPERVIKRSAPQNCNSSSSDGKTPSAHIVGTKPTFYSGSERHQSTDPLSDTVHHPINLLWKCSGLGFVQGGMKIDENGYLTIPKSGTYYVYNQMLLIDMRTNRPYPMGTVTLKKSASSVTSSNQWTVIMKSITSTQNDSIYHGGLFQLEAGDKIGIQVAKATPSPRVKLTAINSYFGVFLI